MANKLLLTKRDWKEHIEAHPELKASLENLRSAVQNAAAKPRMEVPISDMSWWHNRKNPSN